MKMKSARGTVKKAVSRARLCYIPKTGEGREPLPGLVMCKARAVSG